MFQPSGEMFRRMRLHGIDPRQRAQASALREMFKDAWIVCLEGELSPLFPQKSI